MRNKITALLFCASAIFAFVAEPDLKTGDLDYVEHYALVRLKITGASDGPAREVTAGWSNRIFFGQDKLGYIVDPENNQVMKVDSNGVAHVIAGCGLPGYVDGPGDEARFRFGSGGYSGGSISVDKNGVGYVSDPGNNLTRKLTPQPDGSYIVTTVIGGGTVNGAPIGEWVPATSVAFGGGNCLNNDGTAIIYSTWDGSHIVNLTTGMDKRIGIDFGGGAVLWGADSVIWAISGAHINKYNLKTSVLERFAGPDADLPGEYDAHRLEAGFWTTRFYGSPGGNVWYCGGGDQTTLRRIVDDTVKKFLNNGSWAMNAPLSRYIPTDTAAWFCPAGLGTVSPNGDVVTALGEYDGEVLIARYVWKDQYQYYKVGGRGTLDVILIDSITQKRVVTLSSLELFKAGVSIGTSTGTNGNRRMMADSGNGYTFDITAAGYVSKSGFSVRIGDDSVSRMTIPMTRLALSGIDVLPERTDITSNQQKQFSLLGTYADGTKMAVENTAVATWTSRAPSLISVNGSGLATSNTSGGKCYVVAEAAGFLDSAELNVIKSLNLNNPSFETAVSASNWTLTGGAAVQADGGPYLQADAPDGTHVLALQGASAITQSVTFDAGAYKVVLMAAKRTSYGGLQLIKIFIDDLEVGSVTPNTGEFIQYATSGFSVTPGAHTLKFQGMNSVGDNTGFIDQIAIVDTSAQFTDEEPVADIVTGDSLSTSPNPFNPRLNIRVQGCRSNAKLKVLDISGKVVADLSPAVNSGAHNGKARQIVWNAAGHASGVYLVMLKNGKVEMKRKVLLIR